VFTSGDPADAAAKIEEAYALRGVPEIGLRGQRSVEARYTWDKASASLIKAYEDLARARGLPGPANGKPAVPENGGKPQ
jgi:glycosyltransferase involved in cell wall biosynthesis